LVVVTSNPDTLAHATGSVVGVVVVVVVSQPMDITTSIPHSKVGASSVRLGWQQ
jgi:hypothetical protein